MLLVYLKSIEKMEINTSLTSKVKQIILRHEKNAVLTMQDIKKVQSIFKNEKKVSAGTKRNRIYFFNIL